MCQPIQLQHLNDLPALFRAAAQHIEQFGLAQGRYCTPDGSTPVGECPTCTVGALSWARRGEPILRDDDEVSLEAAQFLSRHLPGETGLDSETGEPDFVDHVATWNDTPGRTASEVVTFLRRMAVEAQEAALLCRFITEHDNHLPYDWCPETRTSYLAELTQLRIAVAA